FLPTIFMVAALPVTVAHLGTSQAAWIFFFNDYVPEADLLAYSLAAHLTFMLANGTLGAVFLPKAYVDLFVRPRRDDIGRSRPRPRKTGERVQRRPAPPAGAGGGGQNPPPMESSATTHPKRA